MVLSLALTSTSPIATDGMQPPLTFRPSAASQEERRIDKICR